MFKSDAVFNLMKTELVKHPELPAKVNAVFRFDITATDGAKKSWTIDLKSSVGTIAEKSGESDVTIVVSDTDFLGLVSGDLDPQMAFMQGKIKVTGNIMLAQKMETIFGDLADEDQIEQLTSKL